MKLGRYFFLLILVLSSIFIVLFLFQNFIYIQGENQQSASQTIAVSPVVALPSPTQQPTPTFTPTIVVLKKASYTIAIFGDSMVDTMGDKLEFLEKSLSNKYPTTKFKLYNYGIGGQNVEQGLTRFEKEFSNKTRQYPPLPTIAPDVIIIGSFAYNPFSPHDKNKHYTFLSELVLKAKSIMSRVYLLAEIAPIKIGFGKGKNGVNWTDDERHQHAIRIIEQLDNAISVASLQNIGLINTYYLSRIDGQYGNPYYVNPDDGIHPSAAGHSFMGSLIAESIKFE